MDSLPRQKIILLLKLYYWEPRRYGTSVRRVPSVLDAHSLTSNRPAPKRLPSMSHPTSNSAPVRAVPMLECLEDRTLLNGSPMTLLVELNDHSVTVTGIVRSASDLLVISNDHDRLDNGNSRGHDSSDDHGRNSSWFDDHDQRRDRDNDKNDQKKSNKGDKDDEDFVSTSKSRSSKALTFDSRSVARSQAVAGPATINLAASSPAPAATPVAIAAASGVRVAANVPPVPVDSVTATTTDDVSIQTASAKVAEPAVVPVEGQVDAQATTQNGLRKIGPEKDLARPTLREFDLLERGPGLDQLSRLAGSYSESENQIGVVVSESDVG